MNSTYFLIMLLLTQALYILSYVMNSRLRKRLWKAIGNYQIIVSHQQETITYQEQTIKTLSAQLKV